MNPGHTRRDLLRASLRLGLGLGFAGIGGAAFTALGGRDLIGCAPRIALPPQGGSGLSGPVLPPLPGPAPLPAAFRRGFNHAHLHREGYGYGSARSSAQLRRLHALGTRWIALNPFAWMPSLRAPEVRYGGDPTMQRDHLLREMAAIRDAGMSVVLKPHLWAGSFWAGGFPGDIEMESAAAWAAWFDAYGAWALDLAALARDGGADLFCVGIECTRASLACPGAWGRIADRVRQVYSGPLCYGANWYAEVEGFRDWASFDTVGVNAYFPLVPDDSAADPADSPATAALIDGWQPHLRLLSGLAAATGKPILFTEAGYQALRGAAARPWNSAGDVPDPALQARAWDALFRACAPQPWFDGVLAWKWFTDLPGEDDPFLPAPETQAVIGRWFSEGSAGG